MDLKGNSVAGNKEIEEVEMLNFIKN